LDAAVGADVDAAVPEGAGDEDGDSDVLRFSARELQQIAAEGEFGDIEFRASERAREKLLRLQHDRRDAEAGDRHAAVEQRRSAIVVPAGDGDEWIGHDKEKRSAPRAPRSVSRNAPTSA